MSGDLTIGRWLSDRARTTPDRVAIRYLDAELTYEALDRRAARLAAGLAERGLRRGDRLATLTGTSPDHVATFFACARLGVALQPISWRLAPAEIAPAHAVARVLVHGLFGMGPRPPGFLHLHAVVFRVHRAALVIQRRDVLVHLEGGPRQIRRRCL